MTLPLSELRATGVAIAVRDADDQDAIDGVMPGAVIAPRTPDAVAATLAWASERRLTTVIRGGGTKLGWGRPPARVDVILEMRRLNRLIAHQQGDLTATVEAGATLAEVNQALSAFGQWLPLDPPFSERATIGGLLATNDSGPVRHRFGTPRDLVIGIHLATTDGRLAKAGGQVVKNVAGYDLSKLVSGSLGGLVAIVAATFKLSPLPQASSTIVVDGIGSHALAAVVQRLMETQLEPVAAEVHAIRGPDADGSTSCLLRFASVPAAVDAQVTQARSCVAAASGAVRLASGQAEQDLWRDHASRLWHAPGAVVRASWMPAGLLSALTVLERMSAEGTVEIVGRAGVGAGLIRIEGDLSRQAAAIERLRSSDVFGHVVVIRATTELKAAVGVWPAGAATPLSSAVKRALDPNGILGAGRGPG